MVDVTHDRHDRRTRHQVFGLVLDRVDGLFHVGVGNANRLVAEFFDHQFGSVGIDGLVHRDHHAHLHQHLDDVGGTFGHPVRQFADNDGFRQLNVADLLFGLLAKTKRLGARLFLLAFHRGKAALAAAFVRNGVRQGQLARAAAFVACATLGATVGTVVLFAVGLSRGRQAGLGRSRAAGIITRSSRGGRRSTVGRLGGCRRSGHGRARLGAQNIGAAGFGCSDLGSGFCLGGAFLFLGLQTKGLGAFAILTLFRLDLGAAKGAVFFPHAVFLGTAGGILGLARLGGAKGRHATFHFGIRDACGPLRRVTIVRWRSRLARARCARLWRGSGNHHALAFGFDHDAFGPAMAEALLHLSGTGGTPTKAKRLLAVCIAHASYVSFMAVSPPSSPPACPGKCPRRPASFAASSTTRVLSPPAASAACIARSRPNAKPISPADKTPIKPPLPSGACSFVLPRSDPSLAWIRVTAVPLTSQSFTFS